MKRSLPQQISLSLAVAAALLGAGGIRPVSANPQEAVFTGPAKNAQADGSPDPYDAVTDNYPQYVNWLGQSNLWGEDFEAADNWGAIAYNTQVYGRWGTWEAADPSRSLFYSIPMITGDGTTNLQDGAAGKYNGYYQTMIQNMQAGGINNAILRIGWEMNGGWELWAAASDRASWIAYFRQIAQTIHAMPNSSGFKICWNPSIGYNQIPADQLWPGKYVSDGNGGQKAVQDYDSNGHPYVDYIGVDIYDSYPTGSTGSQNEYHDTSSSTYQPSRDEQTAAWNDFLTESYGLNYYTNLAASSGIPLTIPEWGVWGLNASRPAGGDDPDFIQRMHDWMIANNIAVECYFDVYAANDNGDHQLWPGAANYPHTTNFPKSAALYRQLFGAGTTSGLPIGHRIGIKSQQTGYFASSDQGDSTFLKSLWSTSPGAWETFDVADAGNGNVALLCEQTGKYVSADLNQAYGVNDGAPAGVLRADWAASFGTWETFQWVQNGGGFGLKANNGLYVSCNLNDGDRLEAQWAQSIGAWEQFTYTDLGTDGSLTATDPPVTGTVNLSTLGTTDWAHWGYGSVGHLDHKAVSGAAVGKIKATLPSGAAAFTTTGAAYAWTGGTPTSAATASATGVSTTTGTFALTVPATRTKQTLSIYVGGSKSQGTLTAAASDHSSVPYSAQVGSLSGVYNEVFTIMVAAGQPGQTLAVTWHRTSGTGTVALEAAALH